MTKKIDDKSSKKGGISANQPGPKDSTTIKSINNKENRTSKIFLLLKYNKYYFSW